MNAVDDKGCKKPAIKDKPARNLFKELLNAQFKANMIQHGAHDDWEKNMEKGNPNRGPKPSVTAYLPDGRIEHLNDVGVMKEFYRKHKLPWVYWEEF